MPLTFQSIKLAPNASHTFTFTETVFAFQVGVSSFKFSYPGGHDHHVEELSLAITSNKAGSQNNQVAVQVNGVLMDDSGNGMDYPNSYVVVVCLAWVGSSTTFTNLSGPFTVGNGQQSNPIFMPGSNPNIVQSNLAGFDLSYGNTDHHILGVTAGMGVSTNGNQALLNGTARMWDDSGNTAVNPTATGNLISSTDSNPGFTIMPWTAQQSSGTVTIPMGKSLSSATSLITAFQVQFGNNDDHDLNNIGAGNDSVTVDPSNDQQVLTSGIWAWMGDSSKNTQDNSKSSCSIVVIGILK